MNFPSRDTPTVTVAGGVSSSSPHISTKGRILLHFVPRLCRERAGGPSQDVIHVFHFILPRPVGSQTEGETLTPLFTPSSLFCCFCSPSFFYFGGRLAGLSIAHICSSSLLVFTTAPGLQPPRPTDGGRDRRGGGDTTGIL